jgi:hypothetical protein
VFLFIFLWLVGCGVDRAFFSRAAGARQVATGLNIAKQYGAKVFVTSMCIGSGMGMAAVFVNEQ